MTKFISIMNVDLSLIDLSRSRVRYDGRVLDKCGLSWLIREVAISSVNYVGCILYTDVYWNDMSYSELKQHLLKWLNIKN